MKGITRLYTGLLAVSNSLLSSSNRANKKCLSLLSNSKVRPLPVVKNVESGFDDDSFSDDSLPSNENRFIPPSEPAGINYVLRDIEIDNYTKSQSNLTDKEMRTVLFTPEFNPFFNNLNLLFNILTDEGIHGAPPDLPFTLKSFFEYMLERSSDLHAIWIMLRVCQENKGMLTAFSYILKTQGQEYECRESLLSLFRKIRKQDAESAGIILDLMGFKTVTRLKKFYYDFGLPGFADDLSDDE